MRTKRILTIAMAIAAVTVAVNVQRATASEKAATGDAMSMTYTGCVESVNHGYAFLLTNVDGANSMHGAMATEHHDGMPPRSDNMVSKDDAAPAMQHDQSTMADPKLATLSPKSFALAGAASFSKHVGQKVSVTGTVSAGATGAMRQDVSTLTVKSLKVVARSCS